jgi:hypothetical protein
MHLYVPGLMEHTSQNTHTPHKRTLVCGSGRFRGGTIGLDAWAAFKSMLSVCGHMIMCNRKQISQCCQCLDMGPSFQIYTLHMHQRALAQERRPCTSTTQTPVQQRTSNLPHEFSLKSLHLNRTRQHMGSLDFRSF